MAKTPEASQISTSPQIGAMTEVWIADDVDGLNGFQLFYVQEVPALKTKKEAITYSCLENDEEQSVKGIRKAEDLDIPILYAEEQHDDLLLLDKSEEEKYFFFKLPDSTAVVTGKPLVFYFKASISLANDTIAVEDMLQETATLYKSTNVEEMKGLPVAMGA